MTENGWNPIYKHGDDWGIVDIVLTTLNRWIVTLQQLLYGFNMI